MKESVGEVNMTVVTIVAAGLILTLLIPLLTNVFTKMSEKWEENIDTPTGYIEYVDYII